MFCNLDFKAIAFESDFVAVGYLDDYVNGKVNKMHFAGGFPVNEETKAMIKWLREYNQAKPDIQRVHIFGLEARGFKNSAKLLLDSVPSLSEHNRDVLLKVQNTPYSSLTKKDIAELQVIIPSLYMEASTHISAEVHKHYVRLLEQEVIRYLKGPLGQIGLRDKNMYESAVWIQEYVPNNKLIIWAHNGHVAKSNIYKQAPMGKLLHQHYGDAYYVIATDFNHGEVGVYKKEKKEYKYQNVYYPEVGNKSYEYIFSRCKFDSFFVEVKGASMDPVLVPFLKKSREMRAIGGTNKPSVSKLSISDCFDLIAFFNKTTASK